MWNSRRVLVTGGASFVGSHLVDALVKRKAKVRVVDDLSSGKLENIKGHIKSSKVVFLKGDLKDANVIKKAINGIDTVFHLAADHGGRGYVDLHQAACASNMMLDGMLFDVCRRQGVKKIVYASSGCVYPNYLQTDPKKILYLKEKMVGPPYDADNMYGWAKLMAEMTLKAYYKDYGMKSASCRYFTVYGERGVENHAVIAMIAHGALSVYPVRTCINNIGFDGSGIHCGISGKYDTRFTDILKNAKLVFPPDINEDKKITTATVNFINMPSMRNAL